MSRRRTAGLASALVVPAVLALLAPGSVQALAAGAPAAGAPAAGAPATATPPAVSTVSGSATSGSATSGPAAAAVAPTPEPLLSRRPVADTHREVLLWRPLATDLTPPPAAARPSTPTPSRTAEQARATTRTGTPRATRATTPTPAKPTPPRPAATRRSTTGPTGWAALNDAISRIPSYRPGSVRWVVQAKNGHEGATDWYDHVIYVSPDVPQSRLYSVAVHEWSHMLSVLAYGGDVDAALAAMNARFGGGGPRGVTGAENAADCMARLQGASWTHYTACSSADWRAGAQRLVAGRRL